MPGYPWRRLRRSRVKALWTIDTGRRRSYLLGAPHFFPVSYKAFLMKLIPLAERVIFEGNVEPFYPDITAKKESIDDLLDLETVEKVKEEVGVVLCTDFARVDTGDLIYSRARLLEPWAGFLSIWLGYLEKMGWKHSMEVEALKIARSIGKPVHFLETREEQLEALRMMPRDKIKTFLGKVGSWKEMLDGYREMYEKGDLEAALQCMRHFPTRCEDIIEKRDERLFNRMLPYLKEGEALFLMGTAHCPGVTGRLENSGLRVSRYDFKD